MSNRGRHIHGHVLCEQLLQHVLMSRKLRHWQTDRRPGYCWGRNLHDPQRGQRENLRSAHMSSTCRIYVSLYVYTYLYVYEYTVVEFRACEEQASVAVQRCLERTRGLASESGKCKFMDASSHACICECACVSIDRYLYHVPCCTYTASARQARRGRISTCHISACMGLSTQFKSSRTCQQAHAYAYHHLPALIVIRSSETPPP